MRHFSCQGIILKKTPYSEADVLLTIISPYRGKFTAVAKGVRKISSRRAPNLELLNYIKASFSVAKTFSIVSEVQTLNSFKAIKESLAKTSCGFYVAELCNEFLADGQGDRKIFRLLLETLSALEKKNLVHARKFLRAFEIKLLSLIGFQPQLHFCVRCGRSLPLGDNLFSVEFGGLVHEECQNQVLLSRAFSAGAINALRFLQSQDWNKIETLNMPTSIDRDLEFCMRFYLEYLLEKELKSAAFMHRVWQQANLLN